MRDIIRESPYYQEILEEGREEGLEKGRELERLEQVQGLRQSIIDIVTMRYPKLLRFAKREVAAIDDPAILRGLIVGLSLGDSLEEARERFEQIIGDEDDD